MLKDIAGDIAATALPQTDSFHRNSRRKAEGKSHELMEGIIAHYLLITEDDKAHNACSVEVEIESIEVDGVACDIWDFPYPFQNFAKVEVEEWEGL